MRLRSGCGLTFVIVTHDQEEAMTVANRIGVMNQGRLIQVATPAEIYEQPNSRWVADFIGDVNLIEAASSRPAQPAPRVASASVGTLRAARRPMQAPATPSPSRCGRRRSGSRTMRRRRRREPASKARSAEIGYLGDFSIYKVRLADGFVMKAAAANDDAADRARNRTSAIASGCRGQPTPAWC